MFSRRVTKSQLTLPWDSDPLVFPLAGGKNLIVLVWSALAAEYFHPLPTGRQALGEMPPLLRRLRRP